MSKTKRDAEPAHLKAMRIAQNVAWGPLIFQAASVMVRRGLFRELRREAVEGITVAELAKRTALSEYGVTVLLEAALGAELVWKDGDRFRATRAGLLLERDKMTRVNMNFVRDVCYAPGEHLEEAIVEGRPAGLRELGSWPTVYEGLQELPEPAKTSWFAFDHYYSDDSFPRILDLVFRSRPARLMDVGGNTGKFSLAALRHDPDVRMTVADLSVQIEACRRNLDEAGFGHRMSYHPIDALGPDLELPSGHDVIWMSQFLCCFSEEEMVHILQAACRALSATEKERGSNGQNGHASRPRLLIMDTLWDCQENDIAALTLQATSLYFTVVANGNSRMYDRGTFVRCIERAGLELVDEAHQLGWGHSVLQCVVASPSS